MGSVPQNRSATNGFHRKSAHQSGGGERGSSRKRSPPETRAPSQPESTPRQRFAGNPHAKAAAEGVLLRRIAGERPSEQRIQRFEAGQARLVQRNGSAGKERRASRSSSRGSVSPGSHALGAWETHAAGVDNSTLRRIVGGTSERRIQRFEAGQAWLVQRNGSAGKERRASRSSSRGSVSPGKHASGAGKFRAAGVDNSTLRRIVGGTSEQRIQRFEVGQARFVQRKSFAGEERAEPAGACPAAAFSSGSHALGAGETRAAGVDNSTLRRIGGGQRPSGGFSASKSVRRGSSRGRVSPGKNVPSQSELVLRQRFVGKPRGRWRDPRCGGGQFYAP